MVPLSRILFASLDPDPGQRGLRQVIALALEHDAELVLATAAGRGARDVHAELLVLDACLDGLRVSRRVLAGDAHAALAQEAAREVDLVVLGVERPSGMTSLLRRFPGLDVARVLPVTTWLVPRDRPRRAGVVVAALALGDHLDPAARLTDEQVLAAAAAQAMRTGAALVVAHAWRGVSWDRLRTGAPAADAVAEERRRRIEAMLALCPRVACGAVHATVCLERGAPGDAISRILARESATMLVVGARPRVPGRPGGATLDRLTRGFDGAVLVVRPTSAPPSVPVVAHRALTTA